MLPLQTHAIGLPVKRSDIPAIVASGYSLKQTDRLTFSGRSQSPTPTVQSSEHFLGCLQHLGITPQEVVKRTVRTPNILGSGAQGIVFRIPEMPDYVMKVEYDKDYLGPLILGKGKGIAAQICRGELTPSEFTPVPDPVPDLNIGQAIATIGPVEILKLQKGYSMPDLWCTQLSGFPKLQDKVKLYLQRLSRMPQPSYDKYVKMLRTLLEKGYHFDHAGANIMVDPENKQINVVDMGRPSSKVKTQTITLVSVLETLMSTLIECISNEPEFIDDYGEMIEKVIAKCSKASEKFKMPLYDPLERTILEAYLKIAGDSPALKTRA